MARAATTPSVPVSKRSRAGSAPARGKPYHHGNLREALVSCGKVQLAEVGLADISLRRIAAGVGVSQVAPKHHFGNKEGLLAAIAADGFRDLAAFRASRLRNVEHLVIAGPTHRVEAAVAAVEGGAFPAHVPALTPT